MGSKEKQLNKRKHGADFEEAQTVFYDEKANERSSLALEIKDVMKLIWDADHRNILYIIDYFLLIQDLTNCQTQSQFRQTHRRWH